MVNTLDRYGYVRKTPSAEDGRVIHVELTAKGMSLKADFEAISKQLLDALYGEMSQEDRKTLVKLLTQVEDNLQTSPRTE